MATIIVRSGKGSPLTQAEVDQNFINLNTDKLDTSGLALGSAASPSLKFTGDANTGLYSPGADQLAFSTGGSERARLDSSGRLLVGTSTARSNFFNAGNTALFQVEGTGETAAIRNLNDGFGSMLLLGKSRSTSNTIVQNNDIIGLLSFQGNDGTEFVECAAIKAVVDGTPGANDMPGRLVFSTTADGAAAPTERMTISSAGTTTIASAASTAPFIANIGASEAARLDSSGRLLVGTSTARSNFFNAGNTAGFQVEGQGGFGAFTRTDNDTYGAGLVFAKTRSSGNTIVQNNDTVGLLSFQGSDGSEFVECANIQAFVDGTPGANDMPGRLVFCTTADGATSPTERMRIKSTGIVNIANTPTYADNAAATSGGLVAGDIYRKSDGTLMVRY